MEQNHATTKVKPDELIKMMTVDQWFHIITFRVTDSNRSRKKLRFHTITYGYRLKARHIGNVIVMVSNSANVVGIGSQDMTELLFRHPEIFITLSSWDSCPFHYYVKSAVFWDQH